MEKNILSGKKVAILVESQYIATEIEAYKRLFAELGAEARFMSRLWGQSALEFVSEVEEKGKTPEVLVVEEDFENVRLEDFAAVIMSANYTSPRLRWVDDDKDLDNTPVTGDSGRNAPAVRFFYDAMSHPSIIKGFACHGLWILSSIPETLAGRRVICNKVMLGDVKNAGGIYTASDTGVVVDGDVVTSDGAAGDHDRTRLFVEKIAEQIVAADKGALKKVVTAFESPSVGLAPESMLERGPRRKILILLSEWGYWGEELVAPLEEFDRAGYETVFITPRGRRPNAILVSKDPYYIDPPLGRSVTSKSMAGKVSKIDDPNSPEGARLDSPLDLRTIFPERPYWSDPQLVRMMEIYHHKLVIAEKVVEEFDALLIVGGSGPIVDLANNQRVHDLILAFYKRDKPIAAECYGVACLAFARNIENRKSIIWGKKVTGHCLEYDYKDGTGFMEVKDKFLDFNMGPPPYPLEYILRDATGPDGAFIGNFGHPTSVIVDYPFITGRSTPDSYLTGRKLIEVLDGNPGLKRWGW